jgi:F-type H+-transporting ATPase subunit gamma
VANLKDIRRRIKSVKSTQKITQAMRMVAAAKVKRAETRMKAARPFASGLVDIFAQVFRSLQSNPEALKDSPYGAMLQERPVKNVALLLVSSDRGLCGAFNTTLIRHASQVIRDYQAEGKRVSLYLVGNKVIQAFGKKEDAHLLGQMSNMTGAPTIYHAQEIAHTLMNAFLEERVDEVAILSTRFKSMISFNVVHQVLTPIRPEAVANNTKASKTNATEVLTPELLLEPSLGKVLDQLVPMYMSRVIFALLLESAASELASRMTAMTNATKNASEMISRLTLVYNKARQASITQELLEVVGGAEALNK